MLVRFFYALRKAGIPVSLSEFLIFLQALEDEEIFNDNIDTFYHLARACLVKDEQFFARFDRVFGTFIQGIAEQSVDLETKLPDEWLRPETVRTLTAAERARLQALNLPDLLKELRKRLQEQKERHQGGSQWIGTGGTSPYGSYGDNPAGVRIGGGARLGQAVKVWERREFDALDPNAALSERNLKVALRGLRRFARESDELELDIPGTVESTVKNGGRLDVQWIREHRNVERVLAFFDVGGSMDWHIEISRKMLVAARTQFRTFQAFYFHNTIYGTVWEKGYLRGSSIKVSSLLRRFGPDNKVIIVGDASMAPSELTYRGGAIDFNNKETGEECLQRLCKAWPHLAWLNPVPQNEWQHTESIGIVQRVIGNKMYPLTLDGVSTAVRSLKT